MLRVYDEGRLFGETFGEDPPRVLWLHGWGRTSADFSVAARALAEEGVGSLSVDLPGFGSSPLPEGVGGAELYADALVGLLRQLATQPIILVGHSFGGSVALTLAAREAPLVKHLVLTGTPRLSPSLSRTVAPRAYRWWRWAARRGLVSEARMERARQRYGSPDYRQAHGALREILVASVNESYEVALASLVTPVTFVWGENDRDVPLDVAVRAMALVSVPAQLRTLPGVGHLTPTEAPGALADAVRDALRS
ncbi:MAG TPA: alpha/beta hydrolase [Acidimicrobiales bacterium]|nr:alpha/beta hydrolase [Acidimicrobiales bacterium]